MFVNLYIYEKDFVDWLLGILVLMKVVKEMYVVVLVEWLIDFV